MRILTKFARLFTPHHYSPHYRYAAKRCRLQIISHPQMAMPVPPMRNRDSLRRKRSRTISHLFETIFANAHQSEQKRRQAIREGFDRLTELVPGLEGQGRSEGLVLKRTVDYMREQLSERQAMVDRIEQAGGDVDEKHKRALYQQAANPGRTRG
ncbi:hypothetical protein FOQG_03402 [Fusarium oxysporum f. sp. raphani 54005]|uniref:BHLH domain-containing protein n=2 Tax=Fusarium oxysporum TaxID=5507 RepID=X0CPE0_FUSOX|nr:hypothetical protein FOVG_00330 [Fusarium oxysporum f. sp. pisi HDV247]EXK96320.1 hypothetical protein FOQG_03402 [Fusarium oxysporum f. sp. raphani 54005]